MTCACGAEARRIVYVNGKESCPACSGLRLVGGAKTDGITTRERTAGESYMYEKDIVQPYAKDVNGKLTVSRDFAELYPDSLKNYFFDDEIKKAGYSPET